MRRITALVLYSIFAGIVIAGTLFTGPASAEESDDPWKSFHPLAGSWKGEGSGFGITADVTHEWEFIFQK